ncbi:MAG: HEAT repeat domain-containing protein [Phycisphaerales bacterium]|nr:MAG: HEAT repeat domain-containing protein [Phycisphaerales bacterium]
MSGLHLPAQQPATGPAPADAEQARLQTLVQLITDLRTTPEARRFLLHDLLVSHSPATTSAIADILINSREPTILSSVCTALSELDQPDNALLEPLLTLLRDYNGTVRTAAAQALSAFDGPQAATALGSLALDPALPPAPRLVALRVLAEIPEPPESIDVLINALDDQRPDIRDTARQALLQMGLEEPGPDATAWRDWWAQHRQDPPVHRLRAVLQNKKRRLRSTEHALTSLTARNVALLREIYDRCSEGEKAARLAALLRDSEPSVRMLGIELVNAMIADRKDVPADVLEALRPLITDPGARVRRAAIPVLRDLRIPDDVPLLVSALPNETDEAVLCELINALGRFGDRQAVQHLLPYLSAEHAAPIIAEAADSLGLLLESSPATLPEQRTPAFEQAVQTIMERFANIPAEQADLRERLLKAMAKIADPSFEPSFLAYMDSSRSGMKAAAIQGLAALGNAEHAALVIRHLADANIQVRQLAAQALGRLGNGEDHLESLLGRLDPQAEPVEVIRKTAWESFVRLFRKLEPAAQLRWADRLAPSTQNPAAGNERYVQLLLEIERTLAGIQNEAALLAEVRLRLAATYADMGRHTDAVAYHQQAFDWLKTRPNTRSAQVGLKILNSQLVTGRFNLAAEHLAFLLANAAEQEEPPLNQVVHDYLRGQLNAGEFDDVLSFTDKLLNTESIQLPESWIDRLRLLRREALEARQLSDQHLAAQWVTQLRGSDEEAAAARQQILDLGPGAARSLAWTLLESLDSPELDPALEIELVDLLCQLRPDWPGFTPDTPVEEKRSALIALTSRE